MLNFTLGKTKMMYAAIHTCTEIASAKYKTPHSIQHFCALPKVVKTVPILYIHLIVQNALSSPPPQTWAFKKGVFLHRRACSLPSTPTFSHRGKSQAERLNSYNSPVPILYQEKETNPTFL